MTVNVVLMVALGSLILAFSMIAVLSWREHREEQNAWFAYYERTPEPPSNVELKSHGRPFDYEVD